MNHRKISNIITFNHLFKLSLGHIHSDYVIQFLSDRYTRLPCLEYLDIEYEALATATNNFTNDTIRLNCAKIKFVVIDEPFVRSQNFDSYFPSL
jgi:predicted metallopeptidase